MFRFAEDEDHQNETHFLEACFLCRKPLGYNTDIFMYRLEALNPDLLLYNIFGFHEFFFQSVCFENQQIGFMPSLFLFHYPAAKIQFFIFFGYKFMSLFCFAMICDEQFNQILMAIR